MAFRVAAAQCKKNLPRKAELAWQVSRYLWRPPLNLKIIFSRPFLPSFLSQKWCQISVRIFCVLSDTRNLQCKAFDDIDCTIRIRNSAWLRKIWWLLMTSKYPIQHPYLSFLIFISFISRFIMAYMMISLLFTFSSKS